MGLGHIMTLANSIIGVSVLAMPFCFKQCGIILSILVLFLSSIMTRLACHFLLKAAVLARRRNYEFLAFHAFGPKGKLMVELCIIGFLFGTCIAFFVVMGDLGPAIISEVLGINKSPSIRSSVLLGLALLVVLPLALLRNVDSLSSLCTATILFYFFLVLKIMSEATTHLLAGDWLQYVHLWRPAGILQCIPIFAMALSCQTQVFEIYETLPDSSLPKMNEVVRAAVNICTGVYVCMGFFGYVAVCRPLPSSVLGDKGPPPPLTGNILMSFPSSFSMQAIKLFFVASVACSFPLVIFPCRASLHSLLFRRAPHHETGMGVNVGGSGVNSASTASLLPPGSSSGQAIERIPERRFRLLTVSLVAGSLAVAFALPDIELVLGLVGSSIGTITCLLMPALCFLKVAPSQPYRHSHWGGGKGVTAERLLAQVIIVVGSTILILSTYANLHAVDQARAEEPITPHPLHEGVVGLPKLPAMESNIIIPEALPKIVLGVESVKKEKPVEPVKLIPGSLKKDVEVVKAVLTDSHAAKEVKPEKRQEPPIPVAPDHGVKKKPLTLSEEKPKKKAAEKKEDVSIVENKKPAPPVGMGSEGKEGAGGSVDAVVGRGGGEGSINEQAVKEADSVHGDAIKKEEEEGVMEGVVAADREEERRKRLREEEEAEERRKRAEKEKELLQKLADDRKKQQEQINMQMEILKKLQALEDKKLEPGKSDAGEKGDAGNVVSGKKSEKMIGEIQPASVLEEKSVQLELSRGQDKPADGVSGIETVKQVRNLSPESPLMPSANKKTKDKKAKSQAIDISQNEVLSQKKPPSNEKLSAKESGAQQIPVDQSGPVVKREEAKVFVSNASSISQMKAAVPMPLLLGQQDGAFVGDALKAKEREKRDADLEELTAFEKAVVQDEVVESAVKEVCPDGLSSKVNPSSNPSNEVITDSAGSNTSSQDVSAKDSGSMSSGNVSIKDSDAKKGDKQNLKVENEKNIDKMIGVKMQVNETVAGEKDKGIAKICRDKDAATVSPLICSLSAKDSDGYLSPTIKTPLRLSDPVEERSVHEKVNSRVTLDGVLLEAMPLKRDLKYVQDNAGDPMDKSDGH
ncbi:putative sodium-coupled neutral amino acid transporter 10 [Ischnura elegans]|uniref:putative sodium-coupled neutral amino acid transporter 10 n=1 Tax=Ischnura elegans TaxID=197161 RepID=UPI001ED86B09|nr:putative sodium-coupled neutral amino acid transporter 10 [Ischnura elegans]